MDFTFRPGGGNIEGDANEIDPARLEAQLEAKEHADLWGLCGARPEFSGEFERGAAIGESGNFETNRAPASWTLRPLPADSPDLRPHVPAASEADGEEIAENDENGDL